MNSCPVSSWEVGIASLTRESSFNNTMFRFMRALQLLGALGLSAHAAVLAADSCAVDNLVFNKALDRPQQSSVLSFCSSYLQVAAVTQTLVTTVATVTPLTSVPPLILLTSN